MCVFVRVFLPDFTLLSLCSQTSDLSEAAKPPWPRWQSRRRGLWPRRWRPWRLQTGEGHEGWPVREQAWRATKQDIQSKYRQQEREPTRREVSEGGGDFGAQLHVQVTVWNVPILKWHTKCFVFFGLLHSSFS